MFCRKLFDSSGINHQSNSDCLDCFWTLPWTIHQGGFGNRRTAIFKRRWNSKQKAKPCPLFDFFCEMKQKKKRKRYWAVWTSRISSSKHYIYNLFHWKEVLCFYHFFCCIKYLFALWNVLKTYKKMCTLWTELLLPPHLLLSALLLMFICPQIFLMSRFSSSAAST